jgi:hypothetical protein
MSKKKLSQIQKQYRFEKENNTYLIDVSLDDYDDVYDDWDPAPFKKRFIEEEFDYFIVSSAEDIPLKYDLKIVLYIPDEKKDPIKEIAVRAAYKNYYSYMLEKVQKSRTRLNKKNVSYFMLSIFFLTIGYVIHYDIENLLFNLFKEGILIGGWVFLWEFFTNLFIKSREIKTKYKQFERLYLSEINFIYT